MFLSYPRDTPRIYPLAPETDVENMIFTPEIDLVSVIFTSKTNLKSMIFTPDIGFESMLFTMKIDLKSMILTPKTARKTGARVPVVRPREQAVGAQPGQAPREQGLFN